VEDGVPRTAGWFVINAANARWLHNEMRSVCRFGGEGEAHFDDLGIGLYWLTPGKPMALYHYEDGQEDFLVLRGSCTLVVEGQERPLEPWDLFHCPSGTPHTIIAAGTEPSLVLAVGARKQKGSVRYPVEPAAIGRDRPRGRRNRGCGLSGGGLRRLRPTSRRARARDLLASLG
jgi:uncharacterized cupin superfamily protein